MERLRDHKDDGLAFKYDFLKVPFNNNHAEIAFRLMKVKMKVFGGFRSDQGAVFYAVRAYLSTARKNGLRILTVLPLALAGKPYYPPFVSLPAWVVTKLSEY